MDRFPLEGAEAELAGREMFRGWFFVVWTFAADRDWMSKFANHPWPLSEFPCLFCRCKSTSGAENFRDLRPSAEWRATELSREACLQKVGDSPVWQLPGVTRHHFAADYMHTMDGGLFKHWLGSESPLASPHLHTSHAPPSHSPSPPLRLLEAHRPHPRIRRRGLGGDGKWEMG